MKKGFLVFGILVMALLVSGQGCKDVEVPDVNPTDNPVIDNDGDTNKDAVTGNVVSTKTLVDRSRFVQAGNPPFDSTNVIFTNEAEKGYKVEVSAGKAVNVEIMTDKDCLLKAQGEEYEAMTSKEGTDVVLVGEETPDENRNLCVNAEAKTGEGQVEVKFKVTELSY